MTDQPVGYTYRLRVTPTQERALQEVFDTCRFVWNTALGRWSDLWRHERESLRYGDMAAELTDWRGRFDWLRAAPVVPQQQVLRNLDRGIKAFYSKTDPRRRPRFKKRGSHATASWTVSGFSLKGDRLSVAVPGGRTLLRVVWSRQLPSIPKSVTVYRDPAGRWWASFVVRVEPDDVGVTGQTTGLDLGLRTYATTEFPDADVPNPRFARRAAKALARSQRNLARKQKGSNNRAKARIQTARVHAKVADQRHDWQHKQARILARRFDRIGVEALKIQRLLTNSYRSVARSISDAAWGDFINLLDWHTSKAGHELVRLDSHDTTQTCSGCGAKAKHRLGLADRILSCECGLVLDRDRNAARNLNPDRWGKAVRVGQGVDGSKSGVSAETSAA